MKSSNPKACGKAVTEHELNLVLGYLIHTGVPFSCTPGSDRDWVVFVKQKDERELVEIVERDC